MNSPSPYISAVINDTHGDADNRELILSLFTQYFKFCKKNRIPYVFHGGDFFIDRRGQGLIALYLFTEVGDLARKYGITLHIIPGNHDKTDQGSPRSYLGFYNHSNIIVHDGTDPTVSYIDDLENAVRYHLLPYFSEAIYYEKLEQLFLCADMRNVLITHVGIDGVLNNRGEAEERSIPIGVFKQFDLVLIGHYHNKSNVSKRVRYLGSSHQANFGEDVEKGFTTLSTGLKLQQHPLTSPTWIKVIIPGADPLKIANEVKLHVGVFDNIKFEFRCTEEEYHNVDKEALQKLGIQTVWVSRDSKQLTDTEAEQLAHTTAFTKAEINKNFLHYCQVQKITPDQRRLGLQLIKTAFN
jgi:exonuclease SbcD